MAVAHYVILEFMSDYDLELFPKPLYRNLQPHGYDVGYSTVRGLSKQLAERGLLSKDSNGYYELSDRGESYLNDEIELSDLEDG